jgi:AbiTii
MHDWAMRELRSYGPDDELPEYRKIGAPLAMDAATMHGIIKGQALSPMDIPDFAQHVVNNDLDLRMGIGEIERLAPGEALGDVVRLQPPHAQDLVKFMNAQGNWSGTIERIYWSLAPVAFQGVVEQVRTTLAILVAEIRAHTGDDGQTPDAETATNAINVAVSGRRNKVNVTSAHGAAKLTASPPSSEDRGLNWWTVLLAVLGVLIAMGGGLFALMQAQGWSF